MVREAAEFFTALSIIPSLHIAHPRRTARSSSHAISLTACGTMDKTLISTRANQLRIVIGRQQPAFWGVLGRGLVNVIVNGPLDPPVHYPVGLERMLGANPRNHEL